MATQYQPERMAGIGIPDPDVEPWPEQSTTAATLDADPLVGVPTPAAGQVSSAVLESSGDQTAGAVLTFVTQKPGYAGPNGATFRFHASTDSTARIGHDMANLDGWDYISRSSSDDYLHPDVIALSSGALLVVCDNPGASNARDLAVFRKSATTYVWSADLGNPDQDGSATTVGYRHPVLLELPPTTEGSAGRVLLYAWSYDDGRGKAHLKAWYSDNSGDTWTELSRNVLPGALATATITPKSLDVAYKDGQILLAISYVDSTTTYQSTVKQYASDDLGYSFSVVSVSDPATYSAGLPRIAVSGGFFVVFMAKGTADPCPLVFSRVQDAYTSVFEGLANLSSSHTGVFGWVADLFTDDNSLHAAVTEDGTIALVYSFTVAGVGTEGDVQVTYSYDYGETWPGAESGRSGAGFAVFRADSDGDEFPKHIAMCWDRGRLACVSGYRTGSNTWDDSLNVWYIGGYSSVTMPFRERYTRQNNRTSWGYTWWPGAKPHEAHGAAWVQTLTGAATATIVAAGMDLSAALGENNYWTYDGPPGTPGEGMIVLWQLVQTSGRSDLLMRLDNAVNRWDISVRVTSTGLDLRDDTAGTSIATATASMTSGVQILVAMRNDAVRAWYRTGAIAALSNPVRRWTQIGHSAALTSAAGVAARGRVRFGAAAGIACASTMQLLCINNDDYNGVVEDLVADFDASAVAGRQYSSTPVYVEDGVRIRLKSGSTATGDQWTVTARPARPVERTLPHYSPSPRDTWRSANAAADTLVAYQIGTYDDEHDLGNDMAFLYLDGCNFPDFMLQSRRGGAWGDVTSVPMYEAVSYRRRGSTVVPGVSGSAGGIFVQRNELVGGHFCDDAGNVNLITRNTEGWWASGATPAERRPTIWLADIDGTEDASGTGQLWYPRVLVVLHLSGTRDWRGFRLKLRQSGLGNAAPSEGYHEIGVCAFGHMLALAQRPAWGGSTERTMNLDDARRADGAPLVTRLGPARRIVQVPLTDGRSAKQTRSTQTPDYTSFSTSTGSEPVAGWAETIQTVLDLIEERDDGAPVVYAPFMESGSNGATAKIYRIQRARGAIYGAIRGFAHSTIAGDDERTDALRGGTLTIEEYR